MFIDLIYVGPARGINVDCYHKPCDSRLLNDTVPFANMEFLSLITQTMIDTLVDATQAKCSESNRTVETYTNKDLYNNSGEYILYDKINKTPIVGIDPFRTIDATETNDEISRSLKKRSLLSTNFHDKKPKLSIDNDDEGYPRVTNLYFRKNIDPKSYIPQTFEKIGKIKSSLSHSTRRLKDSDPKSYIPPKQIKQKNIDPKTSAQNNFSLRYQSLSKKAKPFVWATYPSITPVIQSNPTLRILPNYNTWQLGTIYPTHTPLYRNVLPYWVYPVFSPPNPFTNSKNYNPEQVSQLDKSATGLHNLETTSRRKTPLLSTSFCYPFCNYYTYYNTHG